MSDPREHPPEEELFDYAADRDFLPDALAVEKHLDTCSDCRTRLEDIRQFVVALQQEETWWVAGEIGSAEGSRALREFVARRESEDAEAELSLRPLLDSEYRFAYANVARRKRFQTGGVVRLLCETARKECPREPNYALTLAETACVIAEALPDDHYPAAAINELRGTAWKEASTALRFLGRLDSALDALTRAERAYRRLPDSEIQLATVDLCRAAVYWERGQYDDALRYSRSSGQKFADRRDTSRYFEAKEWEAIILHKQGQVPSARETYQTVFDLAETIGDAEMKARAAKNLAIAYRDEGNPGLASKYFSIALQLFEGLDQPAMIAHTRWSIARLALSVGNATEAAQRLPGLVSELERFGMVNYAAHARLDLAEALLVLGRFEDVETACSALVTFYRQAKLLTGALTAAAYLKEAAASRSITSFHISHVRRYLTDLEGSPDLPFVSSPDID